MKRTLVILTSILFTLGIFAQEEDIVLDSLIEMQIDSLLHPEVDTLNMTPEQRWVYHFQQRLDSVVNRRRFARVSSRVSSRSRRRVTRTVEYKYTLGCLVYDLSADSVIYSYNAQRMMKPASTQKLFVATTALSTLGMDYTFDTNVTTDGEMMTDSLGRRYFKGDIYVEGGFDPSLTFSDVRAIADTIHSMGADSIDGRILALVPLKPHLLRQHQWTWDNVPASEEYFITPLTYNKGLTDSHVPRDPVMVTVGRGRRAKRVMQVPAFKQSRIKHPEQYFVSSIYQLLKADSIRFSSSQPYDVVMADSIASRRKHLMTISSPMDKVLPTMMKRSDNFYAESMLLSLSRQKQPEVWTYDACKDAVRRMILRTEGNPDHYLIYDGSGLSHSNRSTPELEVEVLKYAFRAAEIYQPLYESLPIAGIDGTLSSRMKSSRAYQNVRAKTGTINGVSTLAGYLTASNGHELAFSIMVGDLSASSIGKGIEDEICIEMAK